MSIRSIVPPGLFVALGVTLPLVFHGIPNAGATFLPMHLPVFLCGLLCSWGSGLLCGFLTPLLSFLLTGMPPTALLPGMLCELMIYGAMSGFLRQKTRTRNKMLNLYIALFGAMLAGRAVVCLFNLLLFMPGQYSLSTWVTSAFVTAVPGITIQLLFVPGIVLTLEKVSKFRR